MVTSDAMNPLAAYRKKYNLTQSQLGTKLGIPRASIALYETSEKKPSWKRAIEIERLTEGEISRQMLRPDIFPRNGVAG